MLKPSDRVNNPWLELVWEIDTMTEYDADGEVVEQLRNFGNCDVEEELADSDRFTRFSVSCGQATKRVTHILLVALEDVELALPSGVESLSAGDVKLNGLITWPNEDPTHTFETVSDLTWRIPTTILDFAEAQVDVANIEVFSEITDVAVTENARGQTVRIQGDALFDIDVRIPDAVNLCGEPSGEDLDPANAPDDLADLVLDPCWSFFNSSVVLGDDVDVATPVTGDILFTAPTRATVTTAWHGVANEMWYDPSVTLRPGSLVGPDVDLVLYFWLSVGGLALIIILLCVCCYKCCCKKRCCKKAPEIVPETAVVPGAGGGGASDGGSAGGVPAAADAPAPV